MSFSFDIGLATLTKYNDGFLGIQIDGYGEGKAALPEGFASDLTGIMHRPDDPELDPDGQPLPTKSCQCLYWWEGGRQHIAPMIDPRITKISPVLTKGGKQLVVKTGSFMQLDGTSGSQMMYVPYSFTDPKDYTTATKASMVNIDVRTAGAESIQLVHGAGMGLTMTAGGTNQVLLKNKAGDALHVLDDSGHLFTGTFKCYGGVQIGSPAAMPVALAPGTQAQISALQIEVAALATAFAAAMGALVAEASAGWTAATALPVTAPLLTAAATASTAAVAAGAAGVTAGAITAISKVSVSD